jgi:uncharacterized membrane protein HdeD (DUF308 family)
MLRAELNRASRTVAVVLGVIWIVAGVTAGLYGVVQRRWPALLLGPLAVGYGFMWVRVARTGRRLQWPVRRRKARPSRRG